MRFFRNIFLSRLFRFSCRFSLSISMLIVYFAVKAFSALYCLEAPLNCLSINEKNEEKILFCCFASKRNRISSKEEEERRAGRGRFSIQKTKKKSNCSSAGHCLLDWDEPPQDPWPNVGEGVIRKERERKERPPKKKRKTWIPTVLPDPRPSLCLRSRS